MTTNDDNNVKSIGVLSWLVWLLGVALVTGVVVYLIFSVAFMLSTTFKMEVIFSNRVNFDFYKNMSNCEEFGLENCEQVTIKGTAGNIQAWLLSPTKEVEKNIYLLYLHGNAGSRGEDSRLRFYKRLTKLGYHILSFDYRGFADSDGFPSEKGFVEDSMSAYKWLLNNKPKDSSCYLWGHSMGTAVGVQLVAKLEDMVNVLGGMILEAPFNNVTDVIMHSPLTSPLRIFISNFADYLEDISMVFASNYWIKEVKLRTLILHDVSDDIINIQHARKLYYAAEESSLDVQMVEIDERLGHNDVTASKEMESILRNCIR